jgi:hypothetical protein
VDEAVPWLERALAIREQNETAPEELAEVRFFLARALMDSGAHHVRPVALAQQARDGFRRSQAKTPELAEVEAWLSQHADRVQSR